MSDYGPERYERDRERRRLRKAAKRAKKLAKKDLADLDILLDPDEVLADLERDRFAEGFELTEPPEFAEEPEPPTDRFFR